MKLALGAKFGEKVAAVSTVIISLIISFQASWELTLIVCAIAPLFIYSARREMNLNFGMDEERKNGLVEIGGVN